MTKKHSTKKALVASILALCMCFTMLIGTTFAWFTDSVTSTGNVIKSGTLDIEFENYNYETGVWETASQNKIFNYDKWEPGYTQKVNLRVINKGTLALKWMAAITTSQSLSKLADVINVYVRANDKFNAEAESSVAGYINDIDTRDLTAAVTNGDLAVCTLREFIENCSAVTKGNLLEGQTAYLGLILQMDPEAGNDYQNLDLGGKFDITILATQMASEEDSFDKTYDANATYPIVAAGNTSVTGADNYLFDLLKSNGGKFGSALVFKDSIAEDSDEVSITVVETKPNANITVSDDQSVRTFEINAYGLKANNNTEIKVELNVGKNLTGVKLYHNEEEIDVTYDVNKGTIIFFTKTFSPFSLIYDDESVEVEAPETPDVPETLKAIVKDMDIYENTNLLWSSFGPFSKLPNGYQLESVYQFSAPHDSDTISESMYKDWYCDYYVMMDRDVEEGALVLGGNYGEFGWVGFESPEAPGNKEIPLLGTALNPENPAVDVLTYEGVVNFVGNFLCGVSHKDESLNGATFTVKLRLTNPKDYNDYFDAAEVSYTFDNTVMNPTEHVNEAAGEIVYNAEKHGDLYKLLPTLIEDDVLVLNEGTYTTSGTFTVAHGVTIKAAEGTEVIIEQTSAAQDDIFNCAGDATFINLTMKTNRKGYAIADNTKGHNTNGDITVKNCKFIGVAADKNYGVYKNLNGNLTIENCTFDNYNNAVCGVNNGDGSTTNIIGCTFTNINGEAIGYVIDSVPANFEANVIAKNTGLTEENVIGY